jgi:hypothetical protein
MENQWGIKISKIALPEEKLSKNEWFSKLKVSSSYINYNQYHEAFFLNNQYNFSKIKNKQNECTNTGA